MQNHDIQGMDDSHNQVPDNLNIHHIQNLNYGVYINSFNAHSFKMQDSGNHNNCWFLPSCRSSIVSDGARPFIRSAHPVRVANPWPTSLAKSYSCAGSIGRLGLHCAILIDNSFLLRNLPRHSFARWDLGEVHQLQLLSHQFVPTTIS